MRMAFMEAISYSRNCMESNVCLNVQNVEKKYSPRKLGKWRVDLTNKAKEQYSRLAYANAVAKLSGLLLIKQRFSGSKAELLPLFFYMNLCSTLRQRMFLFLLRSTRRLATDPPVACIVRRRLRGLF
jgi:hypothetical protein